MSNRPATYNNEIDLLSLMETVWNGKWKIASIVAVSLLSVFGFNIVKPNTNFTAATDIKPITSFEFDKYSLFNATGVFEVKRETLLNLYIEQIEEGSLLETATDKYNLIDKDNFDSEIEYKDAVEKFASKIKILSPIKEKNEKRLYHLLSAEYDDKDKWKDLLTFVNNEANLKVKATIINRFLTIISIQKQKKDFAIKDLDIKIGNVKDDYERTTKDRLAFLAEQAAIARKLEIKKNTIASQRFNTQNTFVTNVKTDAPFYLRGYMAIDEEINQVKNRKNVSSFTKDLYKLEQEKRRLEQEKIIDRATDLFNKTPLNQTNFKATIVKVGTTDFEENSKTLYHFLAIIIGGMIGVSYVLIANAFITRNDNKLSS